MSKTLKKLAYACLLRSAWLAGVCQDYLNFIRGEDKPMAGERVRP
jgi:hypothetical protein